MKPLLFASLTVLALLAACSAGDPEPPQAAEEEPSPTPDDCQKPNVDCWPPREPDCDVYVDPYSLGGAGGLGARLESAGGWDELLGGSGGETVCLNLVTR